ncbi:MAG: hypothetical protein ACLPH3_09660 [Terracidiphilus sp.]
MNEPIGQAGEPKTSEQKSDVSLDTNTPNPQREKEAQSGGAEANNPAQKKKTWIKRACQATQRYLIQLRDEKPDRHIELFFALVIAVFAIIQWVTVSSNNASTTEQTNQLIAAAKISAQAAKDNVLAAQSFAATAGKINQGMNNAVDRLNAQAASTSDVADAAAAQANSAAAQANASKTIAEATQQSAATAQESLYWEQRPWIGVQNIPVSPSTIRQGENPLQGFQTVVRNFGRTPALRWRKECAEFMDTQFPQEKIPICDQLREINRQKTIERSVANALEQNPKADAYTERQKATKFWEGAYRDEDSQAALTEGKSLVPGGTDNLGVSASGNGNGIEMHYAVGTIAYYDAIQPERKHVTNYCLQRFADAPWGLCNFGQDMK